MGYRTLDQVLVYDYLDEGKSPSYEFDAGDTWYLGLAGELAAEVKCDRITVPMLSRKDFNWKSELNKAFIEAVSLRPQRVVKNFAEACEDFSRRVPSFEGRFEGSHEVGSWFSCAETKDHLGRSVKYGDDGNYISPVHYVADRNGMEMNMRKGLSGIALPPKTVVLLPQAEFLGVLAINEKYFNFLFHPNMIERYFLSDVKISADA